MCEAEARSNRYKKRKAGAIESSVSRRRFVFHLLDFCFVCCVACIGGPLALRSCGAMTNWRRDKK